VARAEWGPAEVFRAVNRALWQSLERLGTGRYMTLNLVRLDDDGLTLAGKHQDLLVWRRATGEVERISNDGCWVGVVDDVGSAVVDLRLPMRPGDTALLFTDGATEAASAAGEMFGDERLARAFGGVAKRPLAEALDALFAEVEAFRARQDDDVTMLLVRHAGGAPPVT
jgi:sigma-B regulation protein RsbU (phosphoserine phosphatase)